MKVAEKLLIRELKRGREDAYKQLVEEYGNRLLRTCYLILRDREEAEDVVQETFVRVFRKIEEFRGESGLYTWIYTIALNLSRDRLRKRMDFSIFENERICNINSEIHIEKVIDRDLLKRELDEISPIYREVLVLFYFEELSVKEISQLLDEKEGTVKSKLSRGRNILKESLLKGGWSDG
ncbi:MAG TPA: hypothetical protein DEF04_10020 [Clostridiales bacterium]|nr:hypothetical protein [Clostridiales bacterium]